MPKEQEKGILVESLGKSKQSLGKSKQNPKQIVLCQVSLFVFDSCTVVK